MQVKAAWRLVSALCALSAQWPVHAHDSWLTRPAVEQDTRLLRLDLSTGSRFPLRETRPSAATIAQAGCRSPARSRADLLPRQEHADHLELGARIDVSSGAACWAELKPQQVELSPELVATYLADIRAPDDVRAMWQQQLARGIGWRESYRKFARIDVPASAASPVAASLRQSQGLAMEIVPLGSESIRAGQPFSYLLLWDGTPLANQWLEFVSERHPLGVWRQTDGDGQVRQALPYAGRWLLRATRLEAPQHDTDLWSSRFATLLVHVR
ncbi:MULTISPECIES: DUF4198 domain-containing protein [Ramlibacter]|uniref:DUF4198 domain-containing protein n=1 Tax=Ramlibacter pinisoli TaxID=2682844 RepID=A0A6N8IU40_9BURK|nr:MULTISPECIES: DUF4198 domain-containing protein [Ramlibacter]MBA2964467.1 DUF4198 domain-containing protein [Ramlibacter sp. CGMCC 1.13660]MVQ29433.1 DUF4198 domain-containing protein [Ramlibacter pinisoli]